MSPPRFRSALRRILGYLGFGVLTLLVLIFALLWVVFHPPKWIFRLPGTTGQWIDRTLHQIHNARLHSWPAADTNDNGVPDWYEELQGFDLIKDAMQADCIVRERPGYVFLGERTRIRLELQVGPFNDVVVRWPANVEILLTTANPVLLPAESPEGTPPTAGPLRVHATPDGRLEFDILYRQPPEAEGIELNRMTGYVTMVHARSGFPYPRYYYQVSHWRLPPVPSHVEQLPVNSNRYPWLAQPGGPGTDPDSRPALVRPHLVWEPIPVPDTTYVLQAARADAPDVWYGFKETTTFDPPSDLIQDDNQSFFPGYTGPLLYRVVPVSREKPAGR